MRDTARWVIDSSFSARAASHRPRCCTADGKRPKPRHWAPSGRLPPIAVVVSVSGDGGSMLLGESSPQDTPKPVKAVVFNNSTLGMVKLRCWSTASPDFQTDVLDTNYAEIARDGHASEDASRLRTCVRAFAARPRLWSRSSRDPNASSHSCRLSRGQVVGLRPRCKIVLKSRHR